MPLILGLLVAMIFFGFLKVLSVSTKVIWKLVCNGLVGVLILFVFNLVGSSFGVNIEPTFINALVAGVFGIPGILILLLMR